MKKITELAREHMMERRGCKISRTASDHHRIDVKCIMCYRPMTTTKEENPPYYCYKCHEDAEGVFGLG
jgi:hypothetical protein